MLHSVLHISSRDCAKRTMCEGSRHKIRGLTNTNLKCWTERVKSTLMAMDLRYVKYTATIPVHSATRAVTNVRLNVYEPSLTLGSEIV